MQFLEVGSFDVTHHELAWPWISIDSSRSRFAFAASGDRIATRSFIEGDLAEGPSFALPADLHLPTVKAADAGFRGAEDGVHGFSIDASARLLAVVGSIAGVSVVVTIDGSGEKVRSRLDALTGADFIAHAVAFDRTGARLWISAEGAEHTALLLIDAQTHAVIGIVKSDPFPRPSFHELYLHRQDDAVLLVAACGQDGTFARVVGFSDGPPEAITNSLEKGSISAGFVGFSEDGARVHLVEADELRTHAWPGLEELSSVDLADDFASSYAGVVMGDRIFIDGEDRDTGDGDAVMQFDRTAIRGALLKPPVPTGMWVGRLGLDALITVDAKGEPARGHVVRLPAPHN
ncbi:MAG: hypothetical protein ABI461_04840 [Polyangiaceae bacterium]